MRIATEDEIRDQKVDRDVTGLLGSFIVRNELINRGELHARTASWGITSLIPGGVGVMPVDWKATPENKLQARYSINMWPYLSLKNPGYVWKDELPELDQTKTDNKQKIGT